MLVVVESPLGGATPAVRRANLRYLTWCCRALYLAGYYPIASHLVCPMFMNDESPEERRAGIHWPWMWHADVPHLFFTDLGVSPGMQLSALRCDELGITRQDHSLPALNADCASAHGRGEWAPNTFDLGGAFDAPGGPPSP